MPTIKKADDGNYYRLADDGDWYPVVSISSDEALGAGLREPTTAETALGHLRALNQGLSLGFGDEIEAAMQAGIDKVGGAIKGEPVAFGDRYRHWKDSQTRQMAAHDKNNPVLSPVAKVAGGIGTGVASAPLAAGKGILGLAGLGGLEGMFAGYGSNTNPDRTLEDIAAGGITGVAVGAAAKPFANVAGRVVQSPLVSGPLNRVLPDRLQIPPSSGAVADLSNVPDELVDSVATADRLGFKLTPWQRTQDDTLGNLEAAMSSRFGGGQPFKEVKDANQQTLNRIVAKSIYQQGKVDLEDAAKTNKALFRAAEAADERVDLNIDAFDAPMRQADEYISRLGKGDKTPKLINDTLDLLTGDGSITPSQYQHLRSGLRRDIQAAYKASDGELADVYKGIQRALEQSADETAPESSMILRKARDLYRRRMPLEQTGVVNAATGDVRFGPLSRAYRKDKQGYTRGGNRSDEYELARLHEAFGNEFVGNSGTATRAQGLADLFLFAKPRELASRAYLANPAYTTGGLLSPTTINTDPVAAGIPPLLALREDQKRRDKRAR